MAKRVAISKRDREKMKKYLLARRSDILDDLDGTEQEIDTLQDPKADDLDRALEDLRRFPLRESASQRLARALRERRTPDLAALIVELHKEKMLCAYPDPQQSRNEPRVICSMGFLGS